ncbi:pyridoxamine 5'-phosphate oxidase family protein [Flammeovirgaceae bacterium SG7u.111]|nr:pyridoxamine 5'-phosphate oxidase family protein [Flammeovirgaceae bacterium SG7u.132]WPO36440.1 pyridoxamine 5'-phosphate oxidase family protein [Flammeovirgaceae bacterium SG7u.111]
MNYANLAFTESIKKLQSQYGSRESYKKMERFTSTEALSQREIQFIEARDSFYMASYGENEFPYVQHRGGPNGFLKVLDGKTLAFLDFTGNKQYISVGNLNQNNKASLILVDYPNQARLKVYAEVEIKALDEAPELEKDVRHRNYAFKAERIILFHIKAYDWNCSQHIKQRFSLDELGDILTSKEEYIKTLEAEVKRLRDELND